MAYDEKLADRIRRILKGKKGMTEKRMFGGLCFLLDGKMLCGISKGDFMARVGPENHNRAISHKYARAMDFTGKPMVGFLFVGAEGLKTRASLAKWVAMCDDYVGPLPKKIPKR